MKPTVTKPLSVPPDASRVSAKDIEEMLYFIASAADAVEARRFDRLSREKKAKAVVVLRRRQERAQRGDHTIDKAVIREIIDDAAKGIFVECEV